MKSVNAPRHAGRTGFARRVGLTVSLAGALVLAACGGGGGGGGGGPAAPAAPAGLTASPGNTQVNLSWPAVTGAASYNVYTSPTSPVTTAATKTTVSVPQASLLSLTNGTPVYAAVTTLANGVESGLSSEVCAVPTAADTTGLTLLDPLCGSTLDGQKWTTPLFGRSVSGGQMLMTAQISNAESRSLRNLSYQTLASVSTASRVSTLQADINVPAATASRSGGGEIRAVARLLYQPPATRLQFPGANQDLIVFEVGLIDSGNGLTATRILVHCDSADCTSQSSSGIATTDPGTFGPTGFSSQAGAPASYHTTYTVTMSLDEGTGILSWTFAGGAFGAGASGTADPSAYLAGNTNWSALSPNPLAGVGFSTAQLGTRIFDRSATGGSAAAITGKFGNVQVGLNNAPALLWDDFSGTGSNSGASGELSLAKWTNAGKNSAALAAGSLTGHLQATSVSTSGFSSGQSINVSSNPASINTMQADINITACSTSIAVPTNSTNRVELLGHFFNDGSPGTTPPDTNQANSNVGDVQAILSLDCAKDQVNFQIVRFNTQNTTTLLTNGIPAVPKGSAPVAGNTHTIRLTYDPTTHVFTFQADNGAPVVVDPTAAGPLMTTPVTFSKPANNPIRQIFWLTGVPPASTVGSTASLDFTLNNVFVAP
jgi:hypothetical protein